MSQDGRKKAVAMNTVEVASIPSESSSKSSRPKRLAACLAVIAGAAGLLLTASAATAAPAGGSNGAAARTAAQPFRVLDKNGNLVGYTVTENMVARLVDNVWVSFYIHPAVGIYDAGAIYLNYLTTDCSGPAYITHYSTFSEGTRVGAKLYYPKDQQQLTPLSVRIATPEGETGTCSAASNIAGVYGVAATVDVSSFGLELPFTAQQ
jgi:hypothetical protein